MYTFLCVCVFCNIPFMAVKIELRNNKKNPTRIVCNEKSVLFFEYITPFI